MTGPVSRFKQRPRQRPRQHSHKRSPQRASVTPTKGLRWLGSVALTGSPGSARLLTSCYALATVSALLLVLFATGGGRPTVVERLFALINVPVAPTLLSVVVLLLATRALLARKRAGLLAVAAFQIVGIAVGILALAPRSAGGWLGLWESRGALGRVLDLAAVLTGALALWWLWRLRARFPGRLRLRHVPAAVTTAATGSLVTVLVTAGLIEATEADGATPAAVAQAVLAAIAGVTRPSAAAAPLWIIHVTAALAALTLLASAVVLLRPTRRDRRWSPDTEVLVRRLLRDHGGRDSLGYLATRRDRDVTFSPDREAALTHRVVAGVSIAAADPVGEPDSWDAAIRAWLADCREEGLTPAVLSASEAGARAYAAAGLKVGRMGDEAILGVETWDLARAELREIARAARHARTRGIVVTHLRQSDLPTDTLADVTACARLWREGEAARGFSMALNRAGDPADGRILHSLARDADGRLVGLLSYLPWGTSGVSLDVMRRGPGAPNGVTELLVSDLMDRARELGVRRVSLNFCMFRDTFEGAEQVDASSLLRGLAWVLHRLDRFWQLARLSRFNQRFDPTWVPRFYCYDEPASLPQVLLAGGIAEGFVPARGRVAAEGSLDAEHLAAVRSFDDPAAAGAPPRRLSQQERHRRAAMTWARAAGLDPFPVGDGEPTDLLADLTTDWPVGRGVEVVARVASIRHHGAVAFITLADRESRVQALLDDAHLGAQSRDTFLTVVDVGDLIRVRGTLGHSRTETRSVVADDWRTEAKALRPVPFTGLESAQARVRDRSADLLVHPDQQRLLRQRSAVVSAVRRALVQDGYLEVETPILQPVHGGATARPFRTWSNAYGMELSLRIAPELYLKRLLVGGLGPVFEIGRNFRNEGADATHNPEFTALEAYRPHADYTDMRRLTERLVRDAATAVHGSPVIPLPAPGQTRQGLAGVELMDVSAPWPVVAVLDAVSAALGTRVDLSTPAPDLRRLGQRHGVALAATAGVGSMLEDLYAELVEPATATPTFFVDFPQETSPLTRPHRHVPGLVERWDLVIAGMEVATAYSELTDPVDQRERLTEQSRHAAAGDPEAMQLDTDFLRALELGMPPAGGLGIGMDRLVMLLTNTPIRSVLAFPLVRPADGRHPTIAGA